MDYRLDYGVVGRRQLKIHPISSVLLVGWILSCLLPNLSLTKVIILNNYSTNNYLFR